MSGLSVSSSGDGARFAIFTAIRQLIWTVNCGLRRRRDKALGPRFDFVFDQRQRILCCLAMRSLSIILS